MEHESPHPPSTPLVEMIRIAAPTVATMLSYTCMQFVDKLFVSRIGPDPIYVGAQGNGGLAAFVPISIAMGILTVVNTYVAQNLGAGRPERAPVYAWNGLWIALVFWVVFLLPFAFFLPAVFRLAALDPGQAALASEYGTILIVGSILTMATRGISQYFYGMHRAGVVLAAGVAANVLNVPLTWMLVFGKFGVPALGVAGSAYATVLATAVELAIPMAVFLGPALNKRFATRSSWRPSWPHIRDILRIGWPAGVNFGNEMVCWAIFMVYLVSHFGTEHATAGWIVHQYMSISFMPTVGISVACTAIVGKYMGMGRPDIAEHRAWLGLKITMVYMSACAVLFLIFREPMIRLFIEGETPPDSAATVVLLGSRFMIAIAAFQLFDAVAMTLSGVLRGAGDTIVPGIATVILSWVLIVGGGVFMVRFVPEIESLGPWIAAASYICVLAVYLFARFRRGAWRERDLLGASAGAGAGAGAAA